MPNLILPGKSYVVVIGEKSNLDQSLKFLGDRMGFRYLKVNSQENFQDTISKVKKLVAIIQVDESISTGPMDVQYESRCLRFKSDTPITQIKNDLISFIINGLPRRLVELIENSIWSIAPKLLGAEFKTLKRSDDFNLQFNNMVTCDSSAVGFSAKAICEINTSKIHHFYPGLSHKNESQLTDLCGELCNQVLGVINFGLRPIGLNPLISLPIGVELSTSGKISQVDYMPLVKLVDPSQMLGIAIGVQIEPTCVGRWHELNTTPHDGDIEYL